jgi:hypothetical protein
VEVDLDHESQKKLHPNKEAQIWQTLILVNRYMRLNLKSSLRTRKLRLIKKLGNKRRKKKILISGQVDQDHHLSQEKDSKLLQIHRCQSSLVNSTLMI